LDAVRKITIQVLQALLFLHHVSIYLLRKKLSIVISNQKILYLRNLAKVESNLLILDLLASLIIDNLLIFKAVTIDPLK